MLDWLKELLQTLWQDLRPWYVVDQYERGVRLRLGRFTGRVLEPGLHFKIPFADNVLTAFWVPTTLDLSEQTVTTGNNVQLVIEATIKYEVEDAAKVLLEVGSASDALADMAKGIIRRCAVQSNWPDTNGEEYEKLVNRKIKLEAKRWGLRVHEVSIVSMAPMRSIRLLQTNSYKTTERTKE